MNYLIQFLQIVAELNAWNPPRACVEQDVFTRLPLAPRTALRMTFRTALIDGLVEPGPRDGWYITDAGGDMLDNQRPRAVDPELLATASDAERE
jgi:hypothetical protein